MTKLKANPVRGSDLLRDRVINFFDSTRLVTLRERLNKNNSKQTSIKVFEIEEEIILGVPTPGHDLLEFIEQITYVMPFSELYLFGGILRDLAIFGRKGFDSDVDLVVDGDIDEISPFLESQGAIKNKFGGYRLQIERLDYKNQKIGSWDVDIWQAQKTWAFKEGWVKYSGIASLLDTTITNWDSILMNWRTKEILTHPEYFKDINNMYLDVVLIKNPNELGMIVRLLRYLIIKQARGLSFEVIRYLVDATRKFSYQQIINSERKSYKNNTISKKEYDYLNDLQNIDDSILMSGFHERFIKDKVTISEELAGQRSLFN